MLQWTRKQRLAKGEVINERRKMFYRGSKSEQNRLVSILCFAILVLLVLGSWAAYFWDVATENNN